MPRVVLTPELIEQVACLIVEEKLPQNEIARLLSVSAATVNRAVHDAASSGLIVRDPRLTRPISDEAREAIRRKRGVEPVESALRTLALPTGARFRELHVFESQIPNPSYDTGLARFAARAAPWFLSVLSRESVRKVGVSWGKTLRELSHATLEECSTNKRPEREHVTFIPLAGSPPDSGTDDTGASHNAHKFSSAINDHPGRFCPLSIRAWVPKEFSKADLDVILRFCFSSAEYRLAFDEKTGIARELDAVVTSIGPINQFATPWLEEAVLATKLSREEFSEITVGNISGWFLPRAGVKKSAQKPIHDVNSRWLGVKREHLELCADRSAGRARDAAAESAPPGVVLVGFGAEKLDVVLAAIEAGLVNILVCEETLFGALSRHFGVEG